MTSVSEAADVVALRSIAEDLARLGGGTALTGRRSLPAGHHADHATKSSATDPVTEFDTAAEEAIVAALRRLRPDDAIIAEEGTGHAGTTGIEWHIDPIDGTANFVYDLPTWTTSVAAVDAEGALAGVVYAPVTDELFSAGRGLGAALNGEPIHPSATATLDMALVATGFSYLSERRARQAQLLSALLPHIRDMRRFGSAALDLCMVACGRLDGYYESHLNSWDVAAGLLIATEAGARATALDGGPVHPDSVLVTTPGVHLALLAALGDCS